MSSSRLARLLKAREDQKKWIADHGGSLSGYITIYGAPGKPGCYGNGGAAIFAADSDVLHRIEADIRLLEGRKQK